MEDWIKQLIEHHWGDAASTMFIWSFCAHMAQTIPPEWSHHPFPRWIIGGVQFFFANNNKRVEVKEKLKIQEER